MQTTVNNNAVGAVATLFILTFVLGMFALFVFIWGTIFKKAGYSFWMALLMIVPIANLVWLLIFAFSKWPIHQELEHYRAHHQGYLPNAFPVTPPPRPPV